MPFFIISPPEEKMNSVSRKFVFNAFDIVSPAACSNDATQKST